MLSYNVSKLIVYTTNKIYRVHALQQYVFEDC